MWGAHSPRDFGRAIFLAVLLALLWLTGGTGQLRAAERLALGADAAADSPVPAAARDDASADSLLGKADHPADLVESGPRNALAHELAGESGTNSPVHLADGQIVAGSGSPGVPLTAPAFAKDSINIEDFYLPEDKPSPKTNAFRIVLAVVALGLWWHFQQHHKRKRRR